MPSGRGKPMSCARLSSSATSCCASSRSAAGSARARRRTPRRVGGSHLQRRVRRGAGAQVADRSLAVAAGRDAADHGTPAASRLLMSRGTRAQTRASPPASRCRRARALENRVLEHQEGGRDPHPHPGLHQHVDHGSELGLGRGEIAPPRMDVAAVARAAEHGEDRASASAFRTDDVGHRHRPVVLVNEHECGEALRGRPTARAALGQQASVPEAVLNAACDLIDTLATECGDAREQHRQRVRCPAVAGGKLLVPGALAIEGLHERGS